jgi:hypothetical protein
MHIRLNRRRFVGLVAGGAALLGNGMTNRTRAAGTPEPAPATPIVGDPASELVLRIDLSGGFVPVQLNLTRTPIVAIYADGAVITTGPMIDIYPSPAQPNLRKLTLAPSGSDKVRAAAADAGLTEGNQYDGPPVTDMPDVVFTYVHDGTTTVTSAYALNFDEERVEDEATRAARAKLIALNQMVGDLANNLDPADIAKPDESYEITRLKVWAQPIDPANPPDPTLPQRPVDWPLASDLGSFGEPGADATGGTRCAVIEGEDAHTLVTALTNANQLTPWVSGGTKYLLWLRPLLPDEASTC